MIISNFQKLTISSQTQTVPPPYSHHYHFMIEPQEKQLKIAYQLQYTERETLSTEEIEEEGFTLDDDVAWEGMLPPVWQDALLAMLAQTHKLSAPPAKASLQQLTLTLEASDTQQGTPDNQEAWEYFLQELTQAVFEASRRELPLQITYLEVAPPAHTVSVVLKASFCQRQCEVLTESQGQRSQKILPWKQLKPLLRAVYLPDYHAEKALAKKPSKPGKYIETGEGQWYALHTGITNPGKKFDAVGALEKAFSSLL